MVLPPHRNHSRQNSMDHRSMDRRHRKLPFSQVSLTVVLPTDQVSSEASAILIQMLPQQIPANLLPAMQWAY